MLVELAIRDFAIIDELRVPFERGFNALTGETGAGKSIIIDALGLVLGERATPDLVRSGAKAASIEAVFDVTSLAGSPAFSMFTEEFGLDPSEPNLVLGREVAPGGRSTARINGRITTAGALAQAGQMLVDIHGQSDHLSLLRPSEHVHFLDRFAGTLAACDRVRELVVELNGVRRSLRELLTGERERERQIDLLSYQINEIDEAALEPGEDERLQHERDVLASAERLAGEAAAALEALSGADLDLTDRGTVVEALKRASAQLDSIAAVDASMQIAADRLREIGFLLEDVVRETRDYRDRIDADPERLEEIEERLDLIKKLQRKYGATIDEILEFRHQAALELERLTGGEMDAGALKEREASLLRAIGETAERLSERRAAAARELEVGVGAAIAELNMGRATFRVDLRRRPSEEGAWLADGSRVAFTELGIDEVEFLLAANPGEALKPLARVASGGEMARLMLALKSVLAGADETPTLVFDEVDVGVGGRSGQVVGEKLWGLTRTHQVIVITHLPQIAAFAEAHHRIAKIERNGRVVSDVVRVGGDERVEEIAAMLDGLPVTQAAKANARQMLDRVESWKSAASAAR